MKSKGDKNKQKAVQLSLFDTLCEVEQAKPKIVKMIISKSDDCDNANETNDKYFGHGTMTISYVRSVGPATEDNHIENKKELINFLLHNTQSF